MFFFAPLRLCERIFKAIVLLLLLATPLFAQTQKNETPAAVQPQNAQQEKPLVREEAKKDAGELKPLVIKSKRVKTIDKASTTTTVTAEDIEARSDKLLKDVLRQVPGMQMSVDTKGMRTFRMRGYDMSRVAILIDGIPLINAYDGQLDIDNIGIMDVSEIMVNRGSSSALFGARGSVGSVNIIKKEPSQFYANASAEYGEHGNYVANFSNGAPIGNFFYYISGTYDKLTGYTVSEKLDSKERQRLWGRYYPGLESNPGYINDTGLWDNDNHEKYKLYGKAGYHITPDLEIGITSFFNNSKMHTSNWVAIADGTDQYEKDTGLVNIGADYPESKDYSASPYVNYSHGSVSVKANAFYYRETGRFFRKCDFEGNNVIGGKMSEADWTWRMLAGETYGINIYPSYRLASWNRLNLGLVYYNASHEKSEKAYDENSENIINNYGWKTFRIEYIEANYLTLAAEDEIKIPGNINLTLGISYDGQKLAVFQRNEQRIWARYDVYGNLRMSDEIWAVTKDDSKIWGTYDSFNPVAGIVYEPAEMFKLRGSASRKTFLPELRSYADSRYPLDKPLPEGEKAEIRPERSINCNAGFELSVFDRRLTIGSDYFYSRINDKIIKVYTTNAADDYIIKNMDKMTQHGFETTLALKITEFFNLVDLDASVIHTYIFKSDLADARDANTLRGEKYSGAPPKHQLGFDLRATLLKTDTGLIVFGTWQHDQKQYQMSTESTDFHSALKLHNPLLINVKLSQKILNHYEIYAMCRNVTDDYAADFLNPGPGRTWYAGVKAGF